MVLVGLPQSCLYCRADAALVTSSSVNLSLLDSLVKTWKLGFSSIRVRVSELAVGYQTV